jgi:pyridoxamine 5'-phosphate oxidase
MTLHKGLFGFSVGVGMSDKAYSGVDPFPVVREIAVDPFSKEDLLADPIALFSRWFAEAAELPLANAVILATATRSGAPSSRVVLLKDHGPDGFSVFTNYESRKGQELDLNPACSLTFWWAPFARQVRVEGCAVRLSAEISDSYFDQRSRGSQIGAWASPQSRIIEDRDDLGSRVDACESRFKRGAVPRPPFWGGYCIEPHRIEFWQGGEDRLHDRFAYDKQDDGGWHVDRLAP